MARESTSEEPATEDNQGEVLSRPNFFMSGMLRVIDKLIGVLQGLRGRVGAPAGDAGDGGSQSGENRAKSRADSAKALGAEVSSAVVLEKKAPTPVRIFFILVFALVIGGILGMLFSYELFSTTIEHQAEQIGTQRDDLLVLEKENLRTQQAEAEYRDALAETQKKLAETQRSFNLATSSLKNKCDARVLNRIFNPEPKSSTGTTGTAIQQSAVPRTSSASTSGTVPRQPGAARQAGTCDINSSSPDQSLARCLSEFNR